MTPATIHLVQGPDVYAERARVLAAAHTATPERFLNGVPRPPALPTAAWINPPSSTEDLH